VGFSVGAYLGFPGCPGGGFVGASVGVLVGVVPLPNSWSMLFRWFLVAGVGAIVRLEQALLFSSTVVLC
jgi:hypothetical protein